MNKLILRLIQYYNERYIAINIVTCKVSLSFSISEDIYRGRVNKVYRKREKIRALARSATEYLKCGFRQRTDAFFSIGGFVTFIPTRKLASRRVASWRASDASLFLFASRALLLLTGTASRRSPTSQCQRPFICTFHRRSSERDSVNSQVNIVPRESPISCIYVEIFNYILFINSFNLYRIICVIM